MSLTSEGRKAGFTEDQLEFLMQHFSRPGHRHSIGQVNELADALEMASEGDFDKEDLDEDEEDEEGVLVPDYDEEEDED